MKKLILFFLVLNAGSLLAQIELEHTFNGMSANITALNDGTIKYYAMDVATAQCIVYNEDFSQRKSISLPIPTAFTLYDIQYVTDHLFDADDQIEMAITYYRYDTAGYYWEYGGRIVNESGAILKDMPGSGYLSLIKPNETSYKLLSFVYDYSVYPSTLDTKVYGIPGAWTSMASIQKEDEYMAWPNPARESVNIPLPSNKSADLLVLYDAGGKLLESIPLSGQIQLISISMKNKKQGIYFYSVSMKGQTISTGKIVKN